ncbi:MAG: TetR/AcrR family transcriptional regulator [Pseudolabrys sp.]
MAERKTTKNRVGGTQRASAGSKTKINKHKRQRPVGRRTSRMSPTVREREIVSGAVSFFSEFGFEGQTRELAKKLKITQPLLYRYFPTKDALIERVYQDILVGGWNPLWEARIVDRSRPMKQRLDEFYQDYSKVIVTYEWVRLFMFAGLKGLDFNRRYLKLLRERIFVKIVEELRFHFGLKSTADVPVSAIEIDSIWSLHAAIFYLGVRKWIYRMSVPDDLTPIIKAKVIAFVDGVGAILSDEARDRSN